MVSATNTTIRTVNDQIRQKSPNLDAIAQAGSVFAMFGNLNIRSQTQAAMANAARGPQLQGASDDRLKIAFARDQAALQKAIAKIPPFAAVDISTIAACKTQFAADSTVTILTSSPIALAAGSDVNVPVKGKAPIGFYWSGLNPTDVQVATSPNAVRFTASAAAKSNHYMFYIVDFAGKSSDTFELDVTGAVPKTPANPANPQKPAASGAGGNNAGAVNVPATPSPAPNGPPPPPANR